MSRILVVEDDPASLMLISEILRNSEYDVISAIDGQEALDIAVEENPDLIILDVMLPTLNGYQVCERLRTMTQFAKTPILILTVLGEDTHQIRALDAGANGFLTKPFKRLDLLMRIKSLLSMAEGHQDTIPFDIVVASIVAALEQRFPGSTVASRQRADVAERLAMTLGIDDETVKDIRRGIIIRNVGKLTFDETNIDQMNTKEHAIRGLKIVGPYDHKVVETVVRWHHCNMLNDYPAHESAEVREIVNVVIVSCRLCTLLFDAPKHSREQAREILNKEINIGMWPKKEAEMLIRLIVR